MITQVFKLVSFISILGTTAQLVSQDRTSHGAATDFDYPFAIPTQNWQTQPSAPVHPRPGDNFSTRAITSLSDHGSVASSTTSSHRSGLAYRAGRPPAEVPRATSSCWELLCCCGCLKRIFGGYDEVTRVEYGEPV